MSQCKWHSSVKKVLILTAIVMQHACTSLPTLAPSAVPPMERHQIDRLEHFAVQGRMSIRTTDPRMPQATSASLRYSWQEAPERTKILLETSLGTIFAAIRRQEANGAYYLSTGSEPSRSFASLEALAHEVFQLHQFAAKPLPAGILRDFMLGRRQDYWQQWQRQQPEGMWRDLRWQVEYPDHAALPSRLILSHPQFEWRLSMSVWSLEKSEW
jgi:outer membrane biogenesis lipoprotein LolB